MWQERCRLEKNRTSSLEALKDVVNVCLSILVEIAFFWSFLLLSCHDYFSDFRVLRVLFLMFPGPSRSFSMLLNMFFAFCTSRKGKLKELEGHCRKLEVGRSALGKCDLSVVISFHFALDARAIIAGRPQESPSLGLSFFLSKKDWNHIEMFSDDLSGCQRWKWNEQNYYRHSHLGISMNLISKSKYVCHIITWQASQQVAIAHHLFPTLWPSQLLHHWKLKLWNSFPAISTSCSGSVSKFKKMGLNSLMNARFLACFPAACRQENLSFSRIMRFPSLWPLTMLTRLLQPMVLLLPQQVQWPPSIRPSSRTRNKDSWQRLRLFDLVHKSVSFVGPETYWTILLSPHSCVLLVNFENSRYSIWMSFVSKHSNSDGECYGNKRHQSTVLSALYWAASVHSAANGLEVSPSPLSARWGRLRFPSTFWIVDASLQRCLFIDS